MPQENTHKQDTGASKRNTFDFKLSQPKPGGYYQRKDADCASNIVLSKQFHHSGCKGRKEFVITVEIK